MKVGLFLFYPGTIWNRGGGESLAQVVYQGLRALGVDAELFDTWRPKRYDLIHLFGSSYHVADVVRAAQGSGARVVVSPCAYSVRPGWQWALWRAVDRLLPVETTYGCRRRLFADADRILPCAQAEARQFARYFGVPAARMTVVPYPCDTGLSRATPQPFLERVRSREFVLMVARVNSIKGQIRLIRAMDGTGIPLVFVGGPDPNEPAYFEQFAAECDRRPHIERLAPIPHDSALFGSALTAARVHALVSVNEYPGIVSVEAGLAGTRVVSPNSPVSREYLGEEADYCEPLRLTSIRAAVLRAYHAPRSSQLQERLAALVDPQRVMAHLLSVYEDVLGQVRRPAAGVDMAPAEVAAAVPAGRGGNGRAR